MISDQALRNNGSKRVTTRPPFRRQNGRDLPPRNDLNGTEISALTTTVNASHETPRAPVVCPVCSHAHKVEDCPELKGLNVDQQAQRAKENRLCSTEHQARQFSQKRSCGVDNCPKCHHPLIHGAAPVFVGAAVVGCISPTVLLQIVPLVVQTPKGNNMRTYALLDSGSQASLILERFTEELGLEGPRDVLTLGTINSKREFKPSRKVLFAVKATNSGNGGPLYPVSEAWTIPQLNLPVQRITRSDMQTWPHVVDLEIPEVDSKDVTMLLGANVLEAILQREVRRGSPGQPAAVLTTFGWTLTGSVKSLVAPESLHVMFVHTVPSDDDLLHRQVQNWWRTDSFGTKYEQTSPQSLEDKRALQTLQETVKHVGDSYQVG